LPAEDAGVLHKASRVKAAKLEKTTEKLKSRFCACERPCHQKDGKTAGHQTKSKRRGPQGECSREKAGTSARGGAHTTSFWGPGRRTCGGPKKNQRRVGGIQRGRQRATRPGRGREHGKRAWTPIAWLQKNEQSSTRGTNCGRRRATRGRQKAGTCGNGVGGAPLEKQKAPGGQGSTVWRAG